MKQETLEAIKENTETLFKHYKKGEISKEEILELRQEAIDDEEYEVAVSIKKVLDTISLEERVEWIALIHKQNLNGRETEDELFEAGILAGIEETKEIMYSEEEVKFFLNAIISEIGLRKENIEKNQDKMPIHLLEGGLIAFESSIDVIKESFEEFKKK